MTFLKLLGGTLMLIGGLLVIVGVGWLTIVNRTDDGEDSDAMATYKQVRGRANLDLPEGMPQGASDYLIPIGLAIGGGLIAWAGLALYRA